MIRLAQESDLSSLAHLLYQVHGVHAQLRPDIFRLGQRKYSDQEILDLIIDDEQPIFVYEVEGQVAGYVFCQFQEVKAHASLHDRKVLFIDDFCVDASYRGQKIGEQLYQYVENFARENDCQALTLNVWDANESALRFYQKLGLVGLKRTLEKSL